MTNIINNTGVEPLYPNDYPHTCVYLGRKRGWGDDYDLYLSKPIGGELRLIGRWGNGVGDYFDHPEKEGLYWSRKYHFSVLGECYRRAMAYLANPENPRP